MTNIMVVSLAECRSWLIGFMAVQRFCEEARRTRFPNTSSAGKDIRVMKTIVLDCVAQSASDWLLSGNFLESLRTPFACDYLVGHKCKDKG